ncbi:MAG: hypothetical protein JKY37_06890 [Nannocystaceae bacterium]|nr:hypothetical protein [Nannocystaceae bacterium]
MPRWTRLRFLLVPMLSLALVVPLPLHAEPPSAADLAAATNAYSTAQAAELTGEYAAAADFYELANHAVPSPEALRGATRMRRKAGHLGAAATHATRLLQIYPEDDEAVAVAMELLRQLGPDLARVTVRCESACGVDVDDAVASDAPQTEHMLYMVPGDRTVTAVFESGLEAIQTLTTESGARVTITFEHPADPTPAAVPTSRAGPRLIPAQNKATIDDAPSGSVRRKLSPAWFSVTVVATAGLGAATLWSGLDVYKHNDKYEADPTQRGFEDGRRAEVRTNILIAGTAVFGVASAALVFVTRWRKSPNTHASARRLPTLSVNAATGAAGVTYGASF